MATNFFTGLSKGFAETAKSVGPQMASVILQKQQMAAQQKAQEEANARQERFAQAQAVQGTIQSQIDDLTKQFNVLAKTDTALANQVRGRITKLAALKVIATSNPERAQQLHDELAVADFTAGDERTAGPGAGNALNNNIGQQTNITPDQMGPFVPGQEPAPMPVPEPQQIGTPVRTYDPATVLGMAQRAEQEDAQTQQTKAAYRQIAVNVINAPDKYSADKVQKAREFLEGKTNDTDWAGMRSSTFTVDDLKAAYANKDWRSAQAAYSALSAQGADLAGFDKKVIDTNVGRLDRRDNNEETLLDLAVRQSTFNLERGGFDLDADKTKLGVALKQDKQAQQKLFGDWATVGNVEALEASKADITALGFDYGSLLARAKTNRGALDEERSNTLENQGLDNQLKAGQLKLNNALYQPTLDSANLKNDLDRAGLAQAGINLEQSRENLAFFKDTKNANVQLLNTQLSAAQQELSENKALSPYRVQQLQEAVKALALDNTLKEKYGAAELDARINSILASTGYTKVQTEQAQLELKFGQDTYSNRITLSANQAALSGVQLEEAGVNLDQAKASLAQFKKIAPLQAKQLEATIASMEYSLEKDKQITPLQIKTLQEQVAALVRDNKIGDLFAEPTAKAQLELLFGSVGLQKTQQKTADLELKFGEDTYNSRVTLVSNQAALSGVQLEEAGVNLDQAKANLAQFKQIAPLQAKQLEATIASMEYDLEKNKQLTPLQVKTLQEQVAALVRDNKIGDLFAEPTAKAQLEGLLTSVGLQKTQAAVAAATAPGQIAATDAQNKVAVDTAESTTNATNVKNDAVVATTPLQIAATDAQNKGVVDTAQGITNATNAQNATVIAQSEAARKLLPFETENKLDVLQLQKRLFALKEPTARAAELSDIASLGNVGLTALDQLKEKGNITQAEYNTAAQAAKNNQTILDTKVAQADQTLLLLPEQTRTLLSTYARTQSDNDLAVLTNQVATDLVGLKGSVEQVGYLADLATTGNLGKPLLKGLLANGTIDQETYDSAVRMADGGQALLDNNVLKTKLDATTLKNDIAAAPMKEAAEFIALADKYASAGTAGLQWLNNPATVKRARELGVNLNSFRDDAKDSQVLAEMGQRDSEYKGSQTALAQLLAVDTDPSKNLSALREVAIGLGFSDTVQGRRDARQYVLDQRAAAAAARKNAAMMAQLEVDEKIAKVNQIEQTTANSIVTTNATVADTNSKINERANDYIIKRYNSETDRQRANQSYALGVGNLNQRVTEAFQNNQNRLAQLAISQGELDVKKMNANTAWQTAYNTNSRADRNFAATQMRGTATSFRQTAATLRQQATSLLKPDSIGQVSDENKAQAAALNAQAAQYESEAKQYSDALGSMGVSSVPQAPATSTTAIPTNALTTMSNGARVTVSFGLGAKYSPELKKMTGLSYHQGMDFVVGGNGAVHNPFEGATVMRVGNDFAGWGGAEVIQLRLANGNTALLAHFQKGSIAVKKDQVIGAGTYLAKMGATGHAKGAHVHLQIIGADGKTVLNPNEFASNFAGVTAGNGPLPAPPAATGNKPAAQPAAPIKNNAPATPSVRPLSNPELQDLKSGATALAGMNAVDPKSGKDNPKWQQTFDTQVSLFSKRWNLPPATVAQILYEAWQKQGGK
jgi:murein DD-endopeptidase MepM/ murein hydrolase activator NlpD